MKFKKPNIIILIILSVIIGVILYLRNNYINNDILSLKDEENRLKRNITESTKRITKLKDNFPK